MSPPRGAVSVVALASCTWLLSSGSAWAFIGDANFAPDSGCSPDTFLQTGVASGSSYSVPAAGVITSWYFHDGPSPIATGLKLKVGHTSLAGATIVGESTAPTVRLANSVNGPFPARIPVQANDVIGIYTSGTGDCSMATASTSDSFFYAPGDLAPNTTTAGNAANMFKIPVAAVAEPDADNDGFGDDTQDFCNTDAITQGPCRPGSLTFGAQDLNTQSATKTVTLSNTSPFTNLSISSVSASGDFVVVFNGCGASIGWGAHCAVGVAFQPTAAGARTGSLSISDAANGSPHAIALNGTGGALPTVEPPASTPTGQRAAALKKCKKKFKRNHNKKRFKKCKKRANLLPL